MRYPNISFVNITGNYLCHCFHNALHHFPKLQECHIRIHKRDTGGATMNARPIFNWKFFDKKQREFVIGVNPVIAVDEKTPIEEVPEDVLIGWFAHELGHIIDYSNRSGWNLLRFGISYLTSHTFRMGAERKADIYAIGHGCGKFILNTKKYILEHSNLSNRYKTRIERYYMSPEELSLTLAEEEVNQQIKLDEIHFFES